MPQRYTPRATQTGTPEQLRQALGYVPARTATGGTGSGVVITGGPAGPVISFDSSVLFGALAFSMGDGDSSSSDAFVIPGPQGAAGAAGAQGPAGPPGAFGWDGVDGQDGLSIPGTPGQAGATGAQGPPGPAGMVGLDGDDGQDGWSIPGVPGPAGANGTIGRDGVGFPGIDGNDGFDGCMMSLPIAGAGQLGIARGDNSTISTNAGVLTVLGNPSVLVYQDGTVPGGNTVANAASETAFASTYTIPSNSLVVGSVIKVKLYGVYSTAVIAPTLIARLKVGGTTVLATPTISTLVGSSTNLGWTADATLIVTAIGASGSMECQGLTEFDTAATTGLLINLTNTAAIGSLNTTGTLALTVTAQWGTASASNTITLRQMVVDIETVGAIPTSGTWTPALSFGGGTTGITYTTQTGVYTKVGRLVTITFNITLSNKGSSTGSALITGLPFPGNAIGSWLQASFAPLAATTGWLGVIDSTGGFSNIRPHNTTGAVSQFTNSTFANNSSIAGTVTYMTD